MHTTVHHKKTDWEAKLKRAIKENSNYEAAVGFPKEATALPHYEDGSSILEVAFWNNFGTSTIPRRAFMEEAAKKMKQPCITTLKQAGKDIINGKTTRHAVLKTVMENGVKEIQAAIKNGQWQSNAQSTIAAKGSNQPLIDSSDLYAHVTGVVREKK